MGSLPVPQGCEKKCRYSIKRIDIKNYYWIRYAFVTAIVPSSPPPVKRLITSMFADWQALAVEVVHTKLSPSHPGLDSDLVATRNPCDVR